MNALSHFDPDSEDQRKPLAIDLTNLSHCPTCRQELKKKVKREDLDNVILGFKLASGYKAEDKTWNRMFYKRYTKPAKELIEFMDGNWRMAVDCVQDISEKMIELGRDYTFETIAKHCGAWKKSRLEQEAKSPQGIKVL